MVTSRVLNEGVDVPEASIAIVLSGTGSTREYIQRLGRILRRGEGKLAILYEVIAEATSEEHTARRRRGRAPDPTFSYPCRIRHCWRPKEMPRRVTDRAVKPPPAGRRSRPQTSGLATGHPGPGG